MAKAGGLRTLHLQTIIEIIEHDRPCVQIAQQLQAVESAIDNAKA
jgi:DNA-binding FrmR family transcriptional regulator